MLKDMHLYVNKQPTAKQLCARDRASSVGACTECRPTVLLHSRNPLLIMAHLHIDVISNPRNKLKLQHCLLFIEEAAE